MTQPDNQLQNTQDLQEVSTQDVDVKNTPDLQLDAELPSSELPNAELNPNVNQATVSLHKIPDTNSAINPFNPAHHNASTSNSHHQGTVQQAMNNASNPFQAPQTNLAIEQNHTSVNTSSWYHASGRIGRLRYVAYQVWIYVLFYFALAMLVGLFSAILPVVWESPTFVTMFCICIIVPWLVYGLIIYPKRRLHDLNISGWAALISFFPFINLVFGLYLMFAAGTEGANDHGDPPRENQLHHWLAALFMPLGMGILAAIAIPAYHDYSDRARQAQLGVEESYSESDSSYDSDYGSDSAAGSDEWQSDKFVINESE